MMNEVSSPVVCVSETDLNSNVIDSEVNIFGYTVLRPDKKKSKRLSFGGGGI